MFNLKDKLAEYQVKVTQANIDILWKKFVRDTDAINEMNLRKSYTQSNDPTVGLQGYNLDQPAKNLFPVLTPLRKVIARQTGGYGVQANWKAITNINVNNLRGGVGEGKRGGRTSHTTEEKNAKYKTIGLEDDVTLQAQLAGQTFQDLISTATRNLTFNTNIQEEKINLGGNCSVALGTTPTPTLSVADNSSSTLGDITLRVICVALGYDSYWDVAGFNNGGIGAELDVTSAVVLGEITRTNADGTTDTFGSGTARKSSAATVSTGATGKEVRASVTAVTGAVAYAWYTGTTSGQEKLTKITTTNSAVFTAAASSGAQLASDLPSADKSVNELIYDGLLYQAFKSGSGAVIKTMATGTPGVGTTLSSDGAGGVVEFEEINATQYNKYRLSANYILVSSQEMSTLAKIVIANGGAPILRMSKEAQSATSVMGGQRVGSYFNKFINVEIPIVVHPNMPPGTVLFLTTELPYMSTNLGSLLVMDLRRDYFMTPWPVVTNKYDYGVYYDGVLKHYAPFSMAVITNIAK